MAPDWTKFSSKSSSACAIARSLQCARRIQSMSTYHRFLRAGFATGLLSVNARETKQITMLLLTCSQHERCSSSSRFGGVFADERHG